MSLDINNVTVSEQGGGVVVGPSIGEYQDLHNVQHWSVQLPSPVTENDFDAARYYTIRWRHNGQGYHEDYVRYVGVSQQHKARFTKS